MPDISVLLEEQRLLRNELNQLKGCQLQYFTLSVTGTAAIFGLAVMANQSYLQGIAFLAPLAIILPCWWIFFDKATTITRIVGYYRVVERMLADFPKSGIKYIGYERALALYRKEDDGNGRNEMKKYKGVKRTRKSHMITKRHSHKKIRHRYWEINWYTYTSLSTFCCILSAIFLISKSSNTWYYLIPLIGILVIALFALSTRKLLNDVMHGEYSYDENHCFWEFIHIKYAKDKNVPCT